MYTFFEINCNSILNFNDYNIIIKFKINRILIRIEIKDKKILDALKERKKILNKYLKIYENEKIYYITLFDIELNLRKIEIPLNLKESLESLLNMLLGISFKIKDDIDIYNNKYIIKILEIQDNDFYNLIKIQNEIVKLFIGNIPDEINYIDNYIIRNDIKIIDLGYYNYYNINTKLTLSIGKILDFYRSFLDENIEYNKIFLKELKKILKTSICNDLPSEILLY